MAEALYTTSEHNMYEVVHQCSHAKRFKALHTHDDEIKFCLQTSIMDIIPAMSGEYVVKLNS
jgi:phosphosulfolactate phosphohydrolase-like enzyme